MRYLSPPDVKRIHPKSETGGRVTVANSLFGGAGRGGKSPICRSYDKFHTVVLKGVGNFSGALFRFPSEISPVKLHFVHFPPPSCAVCPGDEFMGINNACILRVGLLLS